LPRDANAKLPLSALRAIIDTTDRDRTATGDASAASPVLARQCCVADDHPALRGHFPGYPIVPGVLLLQIVRSMLAEAGYRLRECPEVKFRASVALAVAIDFHIDVANKRVARFVAQTDGRTAVTGTFICDKSALRS
jgi:3-hydroxymyristoyl/3-hydroxydecanoyl-(acyl carrier protein) dehydratase